MTELALRERLQPSLLDRLIDDERVLTVYELTFERTRLEDLGILEQDLRTVLAAQGLAQVERSEEGGWLVLRCRAPAGRIGVSQLTNLVVSPNVTLERIGSVTARNVLNDGPETPERRLAVSRRLRELVGRDLSVLLNASSMEVTDELEKLPNVRTSVLNFGLPPYTGRSASSMERDRLARALEIAIRRFEPRLMKVRVTPEAFDARTQDQELSFRIDAQLWGQPAPHQIVLRTRIDTESGKAHVSDLGSL
jgi:type VI secretion system protein ImpF